MSEREERVLSYAVRTPRKRRRLLLLIVLFVLLFAAAIVCERLGVTKPGDLLWRLRW